MLEYFSKIKKLEKLQIKVTS